MADQVDATLPFELEGLTEKSLPELKAVSDIPTLDFWEDQGVDKNGRIIIRIVGKHIPDESQVPIEELQQYVSRQVEELLRIAEGREFTVLYIHSETAIFEDNPFIFVPVRRVYESLPLLFRQRVRDVFVVHPSIALRMGLWVMGQWLSESLYSKITFISRVEFLWEHMSEQEVEVPEFAVLHDAKLEKFPLYDYGMAVNKADMSSSAVPSGP